MDPGSTGVGMAADGHIPAAGQDTDIGSNVDRTALVSASVGITRGAAQSDVSATAVQRIRAVQNNFTIKCARCDITRI